ARMQKAIAIIQFKLEAQVMARHPEYHMQHRAVLTQIDLKRGTVTLEGKEYPLTDTALPTLDPQQPSVLSPEEAVCMERLKQSFLDSHTLQEQMRFVAQRGTSYLIRDGHVIFHGLFPVGGVGNWLPFGVDGGPRQGPPPFQTPELVVQGAWRRPPLDDLDMLWYLWTGPLSPMFGKDKMTTFESY